MFHDPREWRGPAGAGWENTRKLTHYTNPALGSVTNCHATFALPFGVAVSPVDLLAGADPPQMSEEDRVAAITFSNMCVGCHEITGAGGESAPDLSHVGARRDAAGIKRSVREPRAEYPDAMMPPFGERLSEQQDQ